ncbi:MAG: lytic murein transglycosylase, partial [Pseudomonadota bacterium]
MNKFLATCLVSFSLLTTLLVQTQVVHAEGTEPTPVIESEQDFQRWLVEFKIQAVQAGISKQTLSDAFADVQLNQKVLELDRRQPEFTSTFFEYFNRAVSDHRIESGIKNLNKHRKLLSEVTEKYGVPERILVAFWGLETNYGSYTGNIPIIESLATLSYNPRRSRFFTHQLLSALQ